VRKEMPNIFFTSDLHIGHKNILKYNRHEFSTIEDMEIEMVSRWNSKVGKDDIVYILGDVSFTSLERTLFVLSQLNGEKHLILGNHVKR
jgi:calcineurin-like phosphoesterase family protein